MDLGHQNGPLAKTKVRCDAVHACESYVYSLEGTHSLKEMGMNGQLYLISFMPVNHTCLHHLYRF